MLMYEFFKEYPDLDERDDFSYCYVVQTRQGRFIRRGKWFDDNIRDARISFKYRELKSFNLDFVNETIVVTVGGAIE